MLRNCNRRPDVKIVNREQKFILYRIPFITREQPPRGKSHSSSANLASISRMSSTASSSPTPNPIAATSRRCCCISRRRSKSFRRAFFPDFFRSAPASNADSCRWSFHEYHLTLPTYSCVLSETPHKK